MIYLKSKGIREQVSEWISQTGEPLNAFVSYGISTKRPQMMRTISFRSALMELTDLHVDTWCYHQIVVLTWLHTGFHRFTEIGQIFHNIYFFNKSKFQV